MVRLVFLFRKSHRAEFLFAADGFHFYFFVQPRFTEQFFVFFQAAFRDFYYGVFVES